MSFRVDILMSTNNIVRLIAGKNSTIIIELIKREYRSDFRALALKHLMSNYQYINKAPGHVFIKSLSFLYSKKTNERIFFQIISDAREEYFEALQADRHNHARWIHIRGNLALLMAMAAHAGATFGKMFVKIWKATPMG